MDAALKKIDTLTNKILQSDLIEIQKSPKLLALRSQTDPLMVSDIIIALQEYTHEEKLVAYSYSNGLIDGIMELCLCTSLTEQEFEFFELFHPFWSVLEDFMRFKEPIKQMNTTSIQLAANFRSKSIRWLLKSNQTNSQEKFQIVRNLMKITERLCLNLQFTEAMVASQGIEEILEIMKRHFEDTDTTIKGLQVLIEVANFKQFRKFQVDMGVLSTINHFYKTYSENVNLMYHCASLTSLIVLDPTAAGKRIEIMSILSCQLLGLKKFQLNDVIIERILQSIAAIIHQHQSYQQMFQKAGALELIPKFVNDYCESPKVIAAIALVLNSLGYKNLQMKEMIGKKGFVQILNSLLTYFTQYDNYNFNTVKCCLKALGNLCIFKPNGHIMLSMDFVRVCHAFITNRCIVENSSQLEFFCDLILDILYTICQPQNCEYFQLEQAYKGGLIDLILQCIGLAKKSLSLIQKSVDTLGTFLVYEIAIEQFCTLDGFGIISHLIQVAYFDLNLVLSCFQILVQVLNFDQDKVDLLMGYNINIDLVKTIKQMKNNKDVTIIEEILSLALTLSCDSVKCRIMWNSQFLDACFELLQDPTFNTYKPIVLSFIEILQVYSHLQEASAIITEQGSKLLIQIMSENKVDFDIIDEGIVNSLLNYKTLILNLLEVPSNADLFMETALVDLLLAVIWAYIQTDTLVQRALQVFEVICDISDDFREIVKTQSLDHLQKIAETNAEHQQSVRYIKDTIGTITKLKKVPELSYIQLENKEAKEFLTKGVLCRVIKENGASSDLVVYLSTDLQVIQCKHSNHKITKQKWRMRVDTVEEVISNYQDDKTLWNNSPFVKSSGLFKKKPEPARCFAIKGKGTPKAQSQDIVPMTFYICAPTILDKNKLIEYLKVFIPVRVA